MSYQPVTLVNDNIMTIFNDLTPTEISNYCGIDNAMRNVCKSNEFDRYFLNKFFVGNLSSIKNQVPKGQSLSLAKTIYDSKLIDVADTIKGNDLIRKAMILYHIGNYPLIPSMDESLVIDLFNHIYPNTKTIDKINVGIRGILNMGDILERVFSLYYHLNDIMKLIDHIVDNGRNSLLHDIYYLCLAYNRKDVYDTLMNKYGFIFGSDRIKDLLKGKNFGIDIVYDVANNSGMGTDQALLASYLLYSDDNNDVITRGYRGTQRYDSGALISGSEYPTLFFNNYKNQILEFDDFRDIYNGDLTHRYFVPYFVNDNLDVQLIRMQVDNDRDSVVESVGHVALRTLNSKLINWLYDINVDNANTELLALDMINLLPNNMWSVLSIITKGKNKESIDKFYNELLTQAGELGYISVNIYTALVYRLTLSTSNSDTLQEYIDYVAPDGIDNL
ncbi:Hypothetical protein ORPV_272 [Orpheovirus IHUMI-LCC2]|uniref:Uncharacterized protein n=1 Tax=Orpheovirus IHUMI-LCC2 TaxID=2023057 RepID=A0A2I2L3R5_9VIRU|nr:Hypothetical protein ORPV_272 [Orpheovirus IHUMI-LCC2]SNW62176.1 Hypothetical protein ORPV_272 [Orpheovirus IHUMI-LCC2]